MGMGSTLHSLNVLKYGAQFLKADIDPRQLRSERLSSCSALLGGLPVATSGDTEFA